MSESESLILRARITAAEWAALRKLAIDLDVSVPTLVGVLIRERLKAAK